MDAVIRPMVKSDASRLAEICVETGLHSWSEGSFVNEANNPIACYYVLEIEHTLGGFAGMWCVADEAQIMNVGICEAFRRKGYARMLMAALCDDAVRVGCTQMTLEVKAGNIPAIGLYRSMGFYETGIRKDYYPDHSDGILMTKDLCNHDRRL